MNTNHEAPGASAGAQPEWTVGIVVETTTGEVVLRMTEQQAATLRDQLAWLTNDDAEEASA